MFGDDGPKLMLRAPNIAGAGFEFDREGTPMS